MHVVRPNADRKALLVAVKKCSRRVYFSTYMFVVALWKSPQARKVTNVICSSPTECEDKLVARIIEAAATVRQKTGILLAHTSFSVSSLSSLYRGRRPYVWTLQYICKKIHFFFRIIQCFLDFQIWSDPLWWSVAPARTHVRHRVAWQ